MVDDKKNQADTQEPSMEDILASIRRILSEEGEDKADAGDAAAAGGEVNSGRAAPERNAPSLTRPQEREPPEPAGDETVAPDPVPDQIDSEVAFDAAEPPGAVTAPDLGRGLEAERNDVLDLTPEMRSHSMISQETALASTDVLAQLAKAILSRRDVAVGGSDITIEGMVREMLRPMLKEWLDRNLPYLVERLVKREIDLMVNRAERLED